jgi:hypothetical protein
VHCHNILMQSFSGNIHGYPKRSQEDDDEPKVSRLARLSEEY